MVLFFVILALVFVVLLVIITNIVIVPQSKVYVIERLGSYSDTWSAGLHVNEETPSFVEFITGEGGVIDTWLRRGAAGFRLDVADELPDEFIEKIRTAVKRVSPEKFLLGEVWEDATTKFGFDHRRTYLLGKGLDSVMNYPFKNSVLDFVKGKPAQQAANEILSICEHYPAPAINTALNFLSTHDTERALTVIADEPANGRGREWQSGRSVTGEAYEEGMLRLRMAYAIIYTLPGVPCLYYGDEIGMQGYRDPFNRAFFCWDSHEERLRPVLAQLAQLRQLCQHRAQSLLVAVPAEEGAVEGVAVALHPDLVAVVQAGHAGQSVDDGIGHAQAQHALLVGFAGHAAAALPLPAASVGGLVRNHGQSALGVVSGQKVQCRVDGRGRVVLADGKDLVGGLLGGLAFYKIQHGVLEGVVHHAVQSLAQQVGAAVVKAELGCGILPHLAQQKLLRAYPLDGGADLLDEFVRQLVGHIQPEAGSAPTQPCVDDAALAGDELHKGGGLLVDVQAGRPGVGVAAQPLDDVDLGLRHDDDVGDDHQKDNKYQREDHKKQNHSASPLLMGWSGLAAFGENGLHQEQGAVDFGDAAVVAGVQDVAGGHAAGVPVHAVQPDTAGFLGGDGGQHGGFPAKVAVAVGGGVGFAQFCGQRPEGQQAQHAHYDEQQRLHPEQIGEQTADQRGGRADGKPDGGHIKGTTLQHQKADRGNEPEKWGGVHGQFPPYGPIIGHPLGGRSSVFYWNVAQKTKFGQKCQRKSEIPRQGGAREAACLPLRPSL